MDMTVEFGEQRMARGNDDRGLADAARADDRDEALGPQLFRDVPDCLLASYHLSGMRWQVVDVSGTRWCRRPLIRA